MSSTRISWLRILAEGAVIVTSILLAFGIDAWWEGVQRAEARAALIENLIEDFESTRLRASESVVQGGNMIARTEGFLSAAHAPQPVALDSLHFLALGPFLTLDFTPTLASYEAAVSTGAIQLLESRALKEALAEFDQAVNYFELRSAIYVEEYSTGPSAQLRAELGSLRVLYRYNVPYRRVTEAEYRGMVRSPAVSGAMEGLLLLITNLTAGLVRIDEGAQRVVDELYTSKSIGR